jgi:hypothetical protein
LYLRPNPASQDFRYAWGDIFNSKTLKVNPSFIIEFYNIEESLMKYKERGHYISEKGRFAESAFKFCIEKYFPRSVFNPVSGDEHGFFPNQTYL